MYVLDTNVFIDAANAYYAFDLAPGYCGTFSFSYSTLTTP